MSGLVRAQEDAGSTKGLDEVVYERVLAAGDGVHLWFVRPRGLKDDGRFRVAHHLAVMGPGSAVDALVLPARPEVLIAVDGALYCIFPAESANGGEATRQVLRTSVGRDDFGNWRYESAGQTGRIVSPLPGLGQLLGSADDGRQPLVLLKTDERDDEMIGENESGANESESGLIESVDEEVDRGWWSLDAQVDGFALLRLGTNRWETIGLPGDFPETGASCRLFGGLNPTLMVRAEGVTQVYYLDADDNWSEPFAVDLDPVAIETTAAVGGQLVIGVTGDDGSTVVLKCLRRDGLLLIAELEGYTSARALVRLPRDIGLMDRAVDVVADVKANKLVRIDLMTGEVTDECLMNAAPRLSREAYSPLILVGALLLTILVVFLVRPDPTAIRILLPAGTALAKPRRRLMATFLDLLPSALVAIFVFNVSIVEILNWPLFSKDIVETAPALLAILLTVVHSTFFEMLFGRTLGKTLMGCQVLDVQGGRASVRQILLRNLLKIVVFVVPPLALFVFMNPFRQRLGDLVAKTMVVVRGVAEGVGPIEGAKDESEDESGD